jgi:hypothetical protein
MMVLGRSGWALEGPGDERKQCTPWMLKVTEFDRVAQRLAAPEVRLGRFKWGFVANADRHRSPAAALDRPAPGSTLRPQRGRVLREAFTT